MTLDVAPAPRWSALSGPPTRLSPALRDLGVAIWTLVVATLGVLAGLWVAGVDTTDVAGLVLAVAIGTFVLEVVIGPLLRAVAARGSVILALLLGVTAQVLVLGVALSLAVDTRLSVADTLVILVVAAIVMVLGRWLLGATDSAYVVGASKRRRRDDADTANRERGLLVVQMDGVSLEVLRRAIDGGQAPNLDRWIGHTHLLTTWWSTVPSTTPASMAGFLHGDDQHVPAFRWWDREAGRVLAAGNPSASKLVEGRFAAGEGLLRGGGVAVSTTYTGEAENAYLTISNATNARRLGSGASYVPFFSRPFLLPGAIALAIGEMIKEVFQARRQRVRGVEPRIERKGSYVALRAITNVLLRKLNLSLVAEAMSQGRPIVFVDFVDYDEIAHHAGPERPESMRAVEGLDGVLAALQSVAHTADVEYELVVLSDHGQSLGSTFLSLTGTSFGDTVSSLMGAEAADTQESGETWGAVNALVGGVLGRLAPDSDRLTLGPDRTSDGDAETPEVVATGGGNLGMIWFPRLDRRPTLADVDRLWPRLVPGLLASEGVGLVMVTDQDGVPVVLGRSGARRLGDDRWGTGTDPLEGYPSRTAADLARVHALRDSGDLVLISTLEGDRIHAFEEQVGSHGGLGGPQNHAVFLHPRDWDLDPALLQSVPELGEDPVLVGPVAVHRQLWQWRQEWARR